MENLTVQDVKHDDSGDIDPDPKNTVTGWFAPDAEPIPKNCYYADWLPDYLNDLNAMHEAEKVLVDNFTRQSFQRADYTHALERVLASATGIEHGWTWHLLHATAAQRVDAFLKVFGH